MSRPPERWSRVMAVMAVDAGVRADIWVTPVPSRSVEVGAPPPRQRGEGVGAVGLGGPHGVEAELLGRLDLLDGVGRRPALFQ